MSTTVLVILSFVIAAFLSWLISFMVFRKSKPTGYDEELENLREQIRGLQTSLEVSEKQYRYLEQELREKKEELRKEQERSFELGRQVSEKDNELKNQKQKIEEKNEEYQEIQKRFTTEFENIAAKLLKNNSKDFAEANQQKIGELLNPLKERDKRKNKKKKKNHQRNTPFQS